ncbi:DNA-directed RNA polymerase II subunit RPB7 isoform X2 [Tripterygium wilfordii]|uniref:DNA-directed RNA polymerase subunit n=1 Tax=Tripterygium wilfordii TaxID=458696 RepID=A0A7J7BZR1_TRIWF|nr:DNA-directed RNA polymerase II subunit RPB7 isoform X2 [Tripterygium wilfordii]
MISVRLHSPESSTPVSYFRERQNNGKKKMFFHIVLERNMQLHPRHFGRNLRENIVSKLMKDVEGTCSGRHGFVVAITGIEKIGQGLIRDGTGFVSFPVKYQCVVFRPFKGEILEAVVTMVNKMGFFAEAGPVQIFVSNHLIPDDMEFQPGDTPNYTTSDGSVCFTIHFILK